MTRYPSKNEIKSWIPDALSIFQSIMPPINIPYPPVHIATERTYNTIRSKLLEQTGCPIKEWPEASIMEYIHGDQGNAILIRQDLLLVFNSEQFCVFFWHELGHFYAINSEKTNLHKYSNPGLVDDSHILGFLPNGEPGLALSDERLKQEGYWFWQEFIAETIAKFVSFKHRSSTEYYHPELIDWKPEIWRPITDRLMRLLNDTFFHYPSTIDHYSLAHYFANLLMDDFVVLFVKAAKDRKLKIYNGSNSEGIYSDEPTEPTCISDIEIQEFQPAMWKLNELLEAKMKEHVFWMIDEEFLLNIGEMLGNLLLEKIIYMSKN